MERAIRYIFNSSFLYQLTYKKMSEEKVIKEITPVSADTITFVAPDGTTITIRERNGEDEDILSRSKNSQDGSAFTKFLQRIIVDRDGQGPLSHAQLMSMKVRVKYFILLKSRIQSLGSEMIFKHRFQSGEEIEFTEDLSKFDFDYENQELHEIEKHHAAPFLNTGDSFDFTISSGRECRLSYLTSSVEIEQLQRDQEQATLNDNLRVRKFRVKDKEGAWIPVNNFASLTSRELREIRKELIKNDPDFILQTEVKNPKNNTVEEVSLFLYTDFFFPLD